MSGGGRTLAAGLGRVARRLRLFGGLTVAAAVLAVVPAILLVAWVVGAGWGVRGAGPLALVALGAALAVGLGALLTARWVTSIDAEAVASATERARGLPEGTIRGVLELTRSFPPGVSLALFRRSEAELAGRLSGETPRQLAGDLGRRVRVRGGRVAAVVAALGLAAGVTAFAGPDRARVGWAPLLRPVAHLEGPVLPPLDVVPGDTRVDRGAALDITVGAPLRDRVVLHWRAVGDVPRDRPLEVRDGRATGSVGPVDAALDYWVSAPDGAVSDTFRATPRDPLLVTALTVDVIYPRHVGRGADRFEGTVPPLSVPEGTVLRVAGRTTRTLVRALLRRADGAERGLEVVAAGFRAEWRLGPGSSGAWEWRLHDSTGPGPSVPDPLELSVVGDGPPRVRIASPGPDTLLPASRRQPVVAEAVDDHGIAGAALVLRRRTASGRRDAPVSVPLPTGPARDRAQIRGVLDASALDLVPGDVVEYHVVVRDNSPAGRTGRSATHRLRLPGMAELRDRAREAAGGALEETRRLAEEARALEAETRNASRKAASRGRSGRAAGATEGGVRRDRLDFEAAAEATEVASRQAEVLDRIEALRDRMDALRRALDEAGLRDPELERRLGELRELFDELAAPELRAELERLRDAVETLDPEAVKRALERLAEAQESLREEVERGLEQMRRAAAEQELAALTRQAEEIAARQEALADAMAEDLGPAADPLDAGSPVDAPRDAERADSAGGPEPGARGEARPGERAAQQEELDDEAAELGESLRSLQLQLFQIGERDAAGRTQSAVQKSESARQSMGEAAAEARQKDGARASQSGREAAERMADAAQTLEEARQRMGESGRDEARQAVRQATEDALGLAQRQEALREQMAQARPGRAGPGEVGEMRSEQAALRQGLEQLRRNLAEAGRRSALVDREVRAALERARTGMDRTIEGLEDDRGPMPVQQARQSVEALNQLALALLENEGRMQPSMSGTQQALQRLGELAREQGSLNGQVGALAPLQLGEDALRRQLQDLAAKQRGVGRRIGEVSELTGGREDALGQVDQLSTEAEQLARDLEGGRLDADVRARQERLFHRLLDAGRSLEREEYGEERTSERGRDRGGAAPGALDPGLLESGPRYPVPTGAELRALTPAYRRLILEYFDRLNRSEAEVSEDAQRPDGDGRGAGASGTGSPRGGGGAGA